MGYSVVCGVAAIALFLVALRQIPTDSDDENPPRWAWIAIAASAVLLWKPYEVEPNSFKWEPKQNLLSVSYYEPHAPRVRIDLNPDEPKRTVSIKIWASYSPWDWLMLNQNRVTRPQQRFENWKFELAKKFEGERIRWW